MNREDSVRIATALESIAQSLEKLTSPPVVVRNTRRRVKWDGFKFIGIDGEQMIMKDGVATEVDE